MAKIFQERRPASLHQLDKLTGYSGTIQSTPLDTALDEQRRAIWTAQSIVDMVAGALANEFGNSANWPAKLPNFPMALREASRLLEDTTSKLEAGVLEDRALEIARAGVTHG